MKQIRSNLDRRNFLKLSSMALVSPFIMKTMGLVSPKMAIAKASGVTNTYNMAIDKMVEDCKRRFSAIGGWSSGRGSGLVTAESLMSNAAGSTVAHNPFWVNESYAAGTEWGGLIAYPMYSVSGGNATTGPSETPECGYDRQLWPGQDWQFFQPIRVGDRLRNWDRSPQLIEQKVPDRDGIRGFLNVEADRDIVNQRNEIVTTTQNYTVRIFFPEGAPGPLYTWDRYGFTEEEIFFLDKMARAEKVRGAEIRYWEDTNVGDMLDPVVIPPTNFYDIASSGGAGPGELAEQIAAAVAARNSKGGISKLLEKEGVIEREEFIKGPGDLYYKGGGGSMRHYDNIVAQSEGEPGAFLWGNMSIRCMLRCLTNWIGDDAFVRKHKWRHITRTLVGDASWALGRVVDKRMENGEYLVDIFLYQTDMRGCVVDCAFSTVALRSKNETYPGLKKVVDY